MISHSYSLIVSAFMLLIMVLSCFIVLIFAPLLVVFYCPTLLLIFILLICLLLINPCYLRILLSLLVLLVLFIKVPFFSFSLFLFPPCFLPSPYLFPSLLPFLSPFFLLSSFSLSLPLLPALPPPSFSPRYPLPAYSSFPLRPIPLVFVVQCLAVMIIHTFPLSIPLHFSAFPLSLSFTNMFPSVTFPSSLPIAFFFEM